MDCGDTKCVLIAEGALAQIPALLKQHVEADLARPTLIVADENTWRAAGEAVAWHLAASGRASVDPLVFSAEPTLYAEMPLVEQIEARLGRQQVNAVAVGAGTINDMVKLACHRRGRPYMVVGTAASMDGYTAFGASISQRGSKQTFDCAPPRVLVADLWVLAAAPREMACTGYADLLAKVPAGADWLLADSLGIEAIDKQAWELVQTPLREWTAEPQRVAAGEPAALDRLMRGLVASGLAMQVTKSSRPASGAEHQFSHIWDMENHRHSGRPVPHGFKVAIGSLAACALYDLLLSQSLEKLDVDACCRRWPELSEIEARLTRLHEVNAIREKAVEECRAKYVTREQLRGRLERLCQVWPELRQRLLRQLAPAECGVTASAATSSFAIAHELGRLLNSAGAPTHAVDIGIALLRLRTTFYKAQSIRRRYTVLDLAMECGLFDQAMQIVFPGGSRTEL